MLDGVEKLVSLFGFSNVSIDEERVDFRVDVLPACIQGQRVRRERIENAGRTS